jgi:hypothetical protein
MFTELLVQISNESQHIRNDISKGTKDHIAKFLINPDNYLSAPDLTRDLWNKLDYQKKEAFYLFVLINELNTNNEKSRNFLGNISIYLPEGMNLKKRLKLFSSLVQISNIQRQYKHKTLEFVETANIVYCMSDDYLPRDSIRCLLIEYYFTFILISRKSFIQLGQANLIESVLPDLTSNINVNEFVQDSIGDMINGIKGNFQHELRIRFAYN